MTPSTLADRAYLALLDDIVELRRQPGHPLNETDIAADLGMSRTPVREAIKRLMQDGFAVTHGSRFSVVAPVNTLQLRRQFQVREALEVYAYRLAARHPDKQRFKQLLPRLRKEAQATRANPSALLGLLVEIWSAVDAAADNPFLIELVAKLNVQMRRIDNIEETDHDSMQEVARVYIKILEAVIDNDDARAAQLVSRRLDMSYRSKLAALNTGSQGLLGP